MLDRIFLGLCVFLLSFLSIGVSMIVFEKGSSQAQIRIDSVIGEAMVPPDFIELKASFRVKGGESTEDVRQKFDSFRSGFLDFAQTHGIPSTQIIFFTPKFSSENSDDESSKFVATGEVEIMIQKEGLEQFYAFFRGIKKDFPLNIHSLYSGVQLSSSSYQKAIDNAVKDAKVRAEGAFVSTNKTIGKILSLDVFMPKEVQKYTLNSDFEYRNIQDFPLHPISVRVNATYQLQ